MRRCFVGCSTLICQGCAGAISRRYLLRPSIVLSGRSMILNGTHQTNLFFSLPEELRVRARISWHFGASAGQADARRRDAGDVVTSSRSGNAADACPPPRPAGLRLPPPANYCGLPSMIQLGMGAAAKCQIILARALSKLAHSKALLRRNMRDGIFCKTE